jgi:DNA invertase Pin-like site-specific DNA recombinase
MRHRFAALAEKERRLIAERAKAALAVAKGVERPGSGRRQTRRWQCKCSAYGSAASAMSIAGSTDTPEAMLALATTMHA